MRYFFKLDENDVILDAKESIDTIYQWTEVPEFPFSVWVGMMNNPDSIVNTRGGIPQYINGSVGVFIPHPANGLTPPPKHEHSLTIVDANGNFLEERGLTENELAARNLNTAPKSIIIPPSNN